MALTNSNATSRKTEKSVRLGLTIEAILASVKDVSRTSETITWQSLLLKLLGLDLLCLTGC